MTGRLIFMGFVVVVLVYSLSGYLNSKRDYYKILTKKEKTPSVSQSCNATVILLKTIDTMISVEIESLAEGLRLIKQPYNMLRLDDDVAAISKRVFDGIKKEYYNNDELCVTDTYLMTFITKQVTNTFTESVMAGNIQLYAEQREKDEE